MKIKDLSQTLRRCLRNIKTQAFAGTWDMRSALQTAEDISYTYVELTDEEYDIVSRVLEEVDNNSVPYCGKTIILNKSYNTLEEAQQNNNTEY